MPGLLPDAVMTAIRAIAASILDTTCDIRRNPNLDDDGNPQSGDLGQLLSPPLGTDDWDHVVDGVACGFYYQSENPAGVVGAQIGQVATWILSLPYGTDCAIGDRIVDVDGAEYQVHAPTLPQTYSTLSQWVIGKVE